MERRSSGIEIRKDVLLKDYTSFQIGGKADFFVSIASIDDLKQALGFAREKNLPFFILGGGTNVLLADKGFRGLVIHMNMRGVELLGKGKVFAEAGVPMEELLRFVSKQGLAGLEWAGGLPGTIGGAIRGNAGAFGGEIKDSVIKVHSFQSASVIRARARKNQECRFTYRNSIFKKEEPTEIITGALLQLKPGVDPKELGEIIQEKVSYRQERHPLEFPNAGSIFGNCDVKKIPGRWKNEFHEVIKNDPFPVIPTAFLIAQCNLLGKRIGQCEISPKHPNFIVNRGECKAKDVKKLIASIKRTIWERFGIRLEQEVQEIS